MAEEKRVALVTGANRGMGFALCRRLGAEGLRVILTARDDAKGRAAAETLRGEGLEVTHHALEVTDPAAIAAVLAHTRETFGRLDVLVNNAGVILGPADPADPAAASVFKAQPQTLRDSLETNVLGPLQLIQGAVPLMRERGYGRIVNVSTGMGQLSDMGGGWPGYRTSKASLNVLTRVVAAELKDENILINSVCPGWVRTELGGAGASKSVEEGIDTTCWLATLPDGGPSGGFFRDREPIPW